MPERGQPELFPPPRPCKVVAACKDVAWEYAALLGAAAAMVSRPAPPTPVNHFLQEAFLVHVRNLAEFFHKGVPAFEKTGTPPERSRDDDIYAVDFCHSVGWKRESFGHGTKLIQAINKTLSHITGSRDSESQACEPFDAAKHAHGTVLLIRRAWTGFMGSVKPEFQRPLCPRDIGYWLEETTKDWAVRFNELDAEFDAGAGFWGWKLSETLDGPVS